MTSDRGIRIPLSRRSWELILEALVYLVEKPHLDDLEERRNEMSRLLGHIRRRLEEKS